MDTMDQEIVHLFANPYAAIVCVLVAAVETMPDAWVPAPMRRWIGWLCVLACAPAALLLGQSVPGALMSGAVGLSGVWLLLEVVEARSKHRRDNRIPDPDMRASDDGEPPPLIPPPPVQVKDEPPPLLPPPPVK